MKTVFVNTNSIHGQFFTVAEIEDSLKKFVAAIKKLKDLKPEIRMLRDDRIWQSEFISQSPFSQSINRANRTIRDLFKVVIDRLGPDWRIAQTHPADGGFVIQSTGVAVDGCVLAEAAFRNHNEDSIDNLVINFEPCIFSNLTTIEIQCGSIGGVQVSVSCLGNDSLAAFHFPPDRRLFVEINAELFRETNRSSGHGTKVFIELSSGYRWYLDPFHGNHFEVFNPIGDHQGEASLDGQLDRSKSDPRKKFKL